MKRHACILLTILSIVTTALTAQQARFIRYGIKEGLSNETINCLYKDSRGFIWAGTAFGLNRFDGVKFENWYSIPGDSTSLLSNKINTITEDKQQQLWIGTDKGVSVFDMRRGFFKSYVQFSTDIGAISSLEHIQTYCDPDGDIWIGSSRGHIILYRQQTKRFYAIKVELRPSYRLQNEFVSSFLADSKGRLWAATSYGVYRLNKNPLSVTSYRFDKSEYYEGSLNACTRLFETANGTVICGTWNAGYILLDEKQNRFISLFSKINVFPPFVLVLDFAQQDSLIYFSTNLGLYNCTEKDLLNPAFTDYKSYRYNPLDIYAVSSDDINSLLCDTLGNIWIATGKGLNVLNKNNMPYQFYSFQNLAAKSGLSPAGLTQQRENLYLAVHDRLLTFDMKTKTFENGPVDIRNIRRHFFEKYKNGYLLTSQDGIFLYDEKFRPAGLIKEIKPDGYPVNMYKAISDRQGNIWIGTSRYGMRRYNPVNNTLTKYLDDSSKQANTLGHFIKSIIESSNGFIYAGGKNLFVYNAGTDEFEALLPGTEHREINVLKPVKDSIWIGSNYGFFCFNENSKKIKRILLPASVNQNIDDIEQDNQGNWWLITVSGLVKYNTADSSIQVFNSKNGWPGFYSFVKKLDDGRMAAGCEDGIILFNPAAIKKQSYSPAPEITGIVIDEKETIWMPGSDTVFNIRYNQGIRFNFVSLNYDNSSSNQYAWKLEGLNDEWHSNGTQTTQAFAALQPGKYVFQVKSANAGGVWSNNSSAITFNVIPPFYKTAWFVILMGLLITAVVYAFYRFRLQQAIAMEKMRTKIATDLHDDIGATLSSISFYSEAVKQKVRNKMPEAESILEKMGETSRSMVGNMSDIVWAINPKNDTAQSLFKRMKDYAAEFCQLKNTELQFDYDRNIEKKLLDVGTRKNIYLVFKEAVNNALKYSGCSRLKIAIETTQHGLRMGISDNGTGFNTNAEQDGNGLVNMQARAKELKGNVIIHSSEKEGTTIELTCPLP